MKKKIIFVFAIILCSVMCFSGCSFFMGEQSSSKIDDILNNSQTHNQTVLTDRPISSECDFLTPIEITSGSSESEIVNAYLDAVVTVFIVDNYNTQVSFGSGVCIHAGGYIATNNHVISSVTTSSNYSINVYLNNSTVKYDAQLLWTDPTTDVAIIQCENGNIPFVKMKDRTVFAEGEDKLNLLETVLTIGTPLDFSLQNSCSLGNVSGLNRSSVSESNIYEDLIQHTASISNGCSGGPLIDTNGYVIGLNTLGSTEGNEIYFSVPIYPVIAVIDKVVMLNEKETQEFYTTPKIGINCYDKVVASYGDYDFDDNGVYVSSISQGHALDKLAVGDVITKMTCGTKEFNIIQRNDMVYALLNSNVGDTVTFTVTRNNASITKDVVLY